MVLGEAELARVLAGICVFFSVGASFVLIQQHHKHFSKPAIQSKIVGIIYMVPIYAVSSWLSLRFKEMAIYLNMFRDCYEGYALYLFLALMIALLGGGDEYRVVELLESNPPVQYRFPATIFFGKKNLPRGRAFLKWAKFGTLQYSIVKPTCALLAVLLSFAGLYHEGDFDPRLGWIWLTLIINASVGTAFYCLVTFYVVLKGPLQPYDPVPKFLCIKAVLFLSFWQGVVIAGLARLGLIHAIGDWTAHNVQTGIQDLLICIEMVIISVAHTSAFTAEPYKGLPTARTGDILEDHFAHHSAVRDFNEVMPVLLPSKFKPGPARSVARVPAPYSRDSGAPEGGWVTDEGGLESLRTALLDSENSIN